MSTSPSELPNFVETRPSGSDLVERAVAPLAGDAPAGVDLRLDESANSTYYRLRDARSDARSGERQSESDPDGAASVIEPWSRVIDLSAAALIAQTKDVEIAAWLVEGLIRRDGLAGFADGTRIIAGLIAGFWSGGLHPAPDEDDRWSTLAPVSGLSGVDRDGTLMQPLRNVVLFELPDATPVTLWLYERARQVATLDGGKTKESRIAQVTPPFAEIEAVARGSGRSRLATTASAIEEAIAAWNGLEQAIEAAAGTAAIATGRIRVVLEDLRRAAVRYLPAAGPEASGEVSADRPGERAAGEPDRASPERGFATGSRERLLEDVLAIARIFRDREPNSPFGPTLEEAVRRARLPVTELLRELMPDASVRAPLLLALGLRPQAD